MPPATDPGQVTVHLGDCLTVLATLPDASIDAVITDPPYGLEFMGKEWDSFKPAAARFRTRLDGRTNPTVGKSTTTRLDAYIAGAPFQHWCQAWAEQCLRVLRPGGHLLAFGGTRTYHRMVCAIEDAGFEIRDSITWLYGSGFPKSLDVSKAIDKAAGAEREVIGAPPYSRGRAGQSYSETRRVSYDYAPQPITAPATAAATQWAGWGTALKPASETIVVARKPLDGTVAHNVVTHGTGALNIDVCRVEAGARPLRLSDRTNGNNTYGEGLYGSFAAGSTSQGRWPSNVVLSHAPSCNGACAEGCPVAELDAQSGDRPGMTPGVLRRGATTGRSIGGTSAYGTAEPQEVTTGYADSGGASRFFPVFRYQAKAPARERPKVEGVAHPTVKPLSLLRFLTRLVTPPGGTVLDPFAGSGTTVEACLAEGFRCVAIEREAEYLPLIQARIDRAR